jgi:hypothetical protein
MHEMPTLVTELEMTMSTQNPSTRRVLLDKSGQI